MINKRHGLHVDAHGERGKIVVCFMSKLVERIVYRHFEMRCLWLGLSKSISFGYHDESVDEYTYIKS
jgi:hypothetical protein